MDIHHNARTQFSTTSRASRPGTSSSIGQPEQTEGFKKKIVKLNIFQSQG